MIHIYNIGRAETAGLSPLSFCHGTFFSGKRLKSSRFWNGKKKTGFPLLFSGQAAIIMLSAATRLVADARTKPKFGGAL